LSLPMSADLKTEALSLVVDFLKEVVK